MLVDTSVFVDYLRHDDPEAIYFVELVIDRLQPGYSAVITEAELWTGVRNRREESRIAALLSRFETIDLTSSIARLAGNLLLSKSQGELRAHFADALIAASAIELGEPILTADRGSERVFGGQANYLVYR